ncbi:DUF4360 domain-containing protein [Pilimelia columellifera]|uniref:Secreted protein n=1 Tax=Pilimelia columellifera subsp. columellifera TaxID=706583 RepID=A0ABN3NNU7_9ACTN
MNLTARSAAATAAGLAATMLATPAFAAAEPTPPPTAAQITVDAVTSGGGGCASPNRTVTAVNNDGTIAIRYPAIDILAGAIYNQPDGGHIFKNLARANCAVTLQLTPPVGYTYAVIRADGTGYATVPAGSTATASATYKFAGETASSTAKATFDGPVYDTFTYSDQPAEPNWAKCDESRGLNVNLAGVVNHRDGDKSETSWLELGGLDDTLFSLKLGIKPCS